MAMIDRQDMPLLDLEKRQTTFGEVALGYDEKTALLEASRCLSCPTAPCTKGCPVNVPIRDFIAKLKQNDIEGAYSIIHSASSLPAICGRVCPQESQCESKCTLGIRFKPVAIGRLERYVADEMAKKEDKNPAKPELNGEKVAIIGSGPAGLTCAGDLAKLGYRVTVFEALHELGGVLSYGIPEFRLPKAIVKRECDNLRALGVDFQPNVVIGKTLDFDDLKEDGYKAIFISTGAGLPNFMGIPGEELKGVLSANEFLTRSNLMKAYLDTSSTPMLKLGKVAVVGGGNVAMDAARTALRLGAEKVYIVYRRSMEELPARKEEVEHAIEEGVEFKLLHNPTAIVGYENKEDPRDPRNGFVKGMRCIKMELGEPDEKGRRKPVPIEGSESERELDTVIMAIGTSPNPLLRKALPGLEFTPRGGIVIDENGKTSIEGVYAGGDAVTGAATVISAMGAGKVAAKGIDSYLKSLR